MRTFKTEAIIIKRKNIGEADKILTVYTKEQGKLSVIAKGVRRIPSKRSPHVELLNHVMLSLYFGKGMPVLTEAEAIENFSLLKNDLITIGYAYHICELVDRLCPEDMEQRQVFFLLIQTIHELEMKSNGSIKRSNWQLTDAISDDQIQRQKVTGIIHKFEIELLSLLGYWNKSHAMTQKFDTENFIEQIIERKLKSKNIFAKLQE